MEERLGNSCFACVRAVGPVGGSFSMENFSVDEKEKDRVWPERELSVFFSFSIFSSRLTRFSFSSLSLLFCFYFLFCSCPIFLFFRSAEAEYT